MLLCTVRVAGSSPLARGTPLNTVPNRAYHGLIPARAGNTIRTSLSLTCSRAHPRSRGEHIKGIIDGVVQWGSSPLARGTLHARVHHVYAGGLIPARAGNTLNTASTAPTDWAHPRSRGEHPSVIGVVMMPAGSSPLARGTHTGGSENTGQIGLIPARAGNTSTTKKAILTCWAHPRSRGEHVFVIDIIVIVMGSSPLARGTLRNGVSVLTACGLIPARAGNTLRRP